MRVIVFRVEFDSKNSALEAYWDELIPNNYRSGSLYISAYISLYLKNDFSPSISPSSLTLFALQITPLKILKSGFYLYNEINGIFLMILNSS